MRKGLSLGRPFFWKKENYSNTVKIEADVFNRDL